MFSSLVAEFIQHVAQHEGYHGGLTNSRQFHFGRFAEQMDKRGTDVTDHEEKLKQKIPVCSKP